MTMPPTTENMDYSRGLTPSIPGFNLSTHIATAWRRGRAKFNHLLGKASPEARSAYESARPFPHEIVEMILAYLTCDLDTLKACSLTSRSWYMVAVPHIHHTLTLRGDILSPTRDGLKPLCKLYGLGLIPLVKEIRVEQSPQVGGWFAPQAFGHQDLVYFSTFANVHTLKLQELELFRFIPHVERYFKHLSPTLQSITLFNPHCTPRQLAHFLSLFSNLDNIEIWHGRPRLSDPTTPNAGLVRYPTPKLRGRLTLRDFHWVETWLHLITPCDGPRFHHIDLREDVSCAPALVGACAETLETLRFNPRDGSFGSRATSFPEFNLSRLKVLRSLQVGDWVSESSQADHTHTVVAKVFSTITSPVFFELVVVLTGVSVVYLPQDVMLFESLRTMNGLRPFKLVFLLETSEFSQGEARRKLAEALDSVTAQGLLDFLNFPPVIR